MEIIFWGLASWVFFLVTSTSLLFTTGYTIHAVKIVDNKVDKVQYKLDFADQEYKNIAQKLENMQKESALQNELVIQLEHTIKLQSQELAFLRKEIINISQNLILSFMLLLLLCAIAYRIYINIKKKQEKK